MRTAWRVTLIAAIVLALVIGLALAAVLVWGLPHEQLRVFIDGEQIELPPLNGMHWLIAVLAIALASIVVMVVVPFALLLGLAVPLLVLGALLALALAPVVLPVLLVVWLLRRPARTIAR